MIACRIDGLERIRRNALYTAHILRALVGVDWFVALINRRNDVALAIAFDSLAIHTGLSSRQIRARGREIVPAHRVYTCACFAEIVRAHAVGHRDAANAVSIAIADQRTATRKTRRLIGIRRHSIRTDILRAWVVVFGKIHIEDFVARTADSITNDPMTVAGPLIGNGQAHRREGLSTHMIDTGTLLAIVIQGQENAIGGFVAFNAGSQSVANSRLSHDARRTGGNRRIRPHPFSANIKRARIHVLRSIRRIIERNIDTLLTNMKFAIADGLLKVWSRATIERDERACAHVGITRIFGAWIRIVTRLVRTALHRAHAHDALAWRRAYRTCGVIGYWCVDWVAVIA